jgi:hypothetical protein
MEKKTLFQQIDDRRKLTDLCFKHEDGNVFLLDYLTDTFSDIGNDRKDITNLAIINQLFQEYFDTGGNEAGEFVEAAPNLLKFINLHYDFLKEQYYYKVEHKLFVGGFYWFLITEYQQYVSIVCPEPLYYNRNILSDAINKYEEIQKNKLNK